MPTVKEDAILSQLCYLDNPSCPNNTIETQKTKNLVNSWKDMQTDGWQYIGNQNDFIKDDKLNSTGFQAHAYLSPEGQLVFAMRGTEPTDIKDLATDLALAVFIEPDQVDSMQAFVSKVIQDHAPNQVHFTGHSLGGYLAAKGAHYLIDKIKFESSQVTGLGFNNPGIAWSIDSDFANFFSLCHEADIVNHAGGEHLGKVYNLDGGYAFYEIYSSHLMTELAKTIDNNYPFLGQMGVAAFLALPENEKQAILKSLQELFSKNYTPFNEEQEQADNPDTENETLKENDDDTPVNEIASDSHTPEQENTIFGMSDEQWKSFNEFLKKVQDIELVGDNVSALINAYESGDDWEVFESGTDVLSSIDKVIMEQGVNSDPDLQDYSAAIQGLSSVVSSIGDWKDLEEALSNGDGWGIAEGSASLVNDVATTYDIYSKYDTTAVSGEKMAAVGGALTSVVSLGVNVKNLLDTLEDGDNAAQAKAALQVIESAAQAYVAVDMAVSGTTAATGTLSNSLPAIGAAVGIASGVISILDGDAQGGGEQIVIACATYALCCIPVFGWAAALALQVASATRNMDGQLVSTESVEDWVDDVAPLGEEATAAVFASFEIPAEIVSEAYQHQSYLTGVNREMYEDIEIDIPEEMHSWIDLAQTSIDAINGLRIGEYYKDIDEMSLADIWDSTYITPLVAGVIDAVRDIPDCVKTAVSDGPDIVLDAVKSALNPASPINLLKGMFGSDDPDEATANFTLDENGNVVMSVGGDGSMQGLANSVGGRLLFVMQNYKDSGGRVMIEGGLPSFRVVEGEKSQINYGQPGGKITILLDDLSTASVQMRGALVARDHGEQLSRAVKVATLSGGAIDWAKVDATMRGHGFTKRGDNYVIGETKELYGTTTGTGVFRGGGQMGPEGQTFTAKPADITSLPHRTSPLPSQQMGEIIKIVSARNFFSSPGCELAAMSLILGAGLGGYAEDSYGAVQQTDNTLAKPLNGFSLDKYLSSLQQNTYPAGEASTIFSQVSFPSFEDETALHTFFAENWSELLKGYDWDELARAQYRQQHGDDIDYNGLLSDGTKAPWWSDGDTDDYFEAELGRERVAATGEQLEVAQVDLQSYSHITKNTLEVGAFFTMSEDTVLRFLSSSLIDSSTQYQNDEAEQELVSFSNVQNGTIWKDTNGDIRFSPSANFVGTASFTYTLKDGMGNLVQKQALIEVNNVNDDPTINDDVFTLQEGQTFYLDRLLTNDFDTDGDSFLIDHLRGVENGTIDLISGRLAFIPDAGFYGETSFSYWVRDHSDSYPVMGKATLNFQEVNQGGVAGGDRFLILEDSQVLTTPAKLLANDLDHDGEQLSFNGLGQAVNATVVLQSDGTILFTPKQNYTGTNCGFNYSIKDESGNITNGWVAVEVLDQREPPVVTSGTMAPINEDQVFTFSPDQVAKFIRDADGDCVHLDSITNIQGGTVTIKGGYLSFAPDENYSGPASFDYRANDNHRGTVNGHLSFEIVPVNDPIDTGQDILTTQEDNSIATTIADLLSNDSDVDGSVVSFMGIGGAENGTVSINPANQITFTPDNNYTGDDAGFEYYVTDSEGKSSTGWVQIKVNAVNDAPEIISKTLAGTEDTPIVFDAATLAQIFKDVDGDNLSATQMAAASGGTVTEKDGVFTFTPNKDYVGKSQLTITVDDGNGEELTETIEIDLAEQDDPTIFGADSFTTKEEQSVTTTVDALVQNDSDADGNLIFDGLGQAFHGTVSVSALGEIVFTPDENYFGAGAGFEYKVKDEKGFEAVGRVNIEVTGVNDAPTIIGTALTTNEDQPIVFTGATIAQFINDGDGDSISLTTITNVQGGTVSQNGGVYTFTPDADYHGSGFLEYSATDNNGGTLSGSLDISILPQNDVTDFGSDVFSTDEEQSVSVTVSELLANDIDRDGQVTFSRLGDVKNGSITLSTDGIITFTPKSDYAGNEAGFYYVVEDSQGFESTGWVTIDVANINDAPIITGNRLRIKEDETIAFTPEEIARFLFDADGDLYKLDMVANVSGGRLELKNGVYTFTPDADYYGKGGFEYTTVSSSGDSVDGIMNLIIDPINDLPGTSAVSTTGVEDNEIVFQIDQLMAGANDVEDGNNIRFDGINSSLHGDVFVNHADNSLHFIPDDNFFGDAAFSYDVIDSEGGISQGYVAIRFTGVNDAPVAKDDDKIVGWSNNQYENVYLSSTFLANDIDVDNDTLSIVSVSNAEHGTVSLDAAGNVHYVAVSDDWIGIDTFTYTITDGNGQTSTATAKLDVKINTSPDVYPEVLYTKEDIISTIKQEELLANDSDMDGDVMKIIAVDQAEHCNVQLLANGDIKFTPELNYNNNYPGKASFRYTVTDGISDPVTAVAFFDIDPVNDAPILVSERITGAVEDNSFTFQVADIMANDTDVEMTSAHETDSISFVEVFDAAHGTIRSDDTGTSFYTQNPNFCGTETFKYRVVDSYGAESVIESEIWVEPVNDIPVVQEDVATSVAEDCIWNHYSINSLIANDLDVDGDSLTIKNAHVISGSGDVKISGGNLSVKPRAGEDYMEIAYTVTDGNGGDVVSKLTIPNIKEHNFAPEFTGLYNTLGYGARDIYFNFQVRDKNGGDNWVDMGEIATIAVGSLHTNYPSARIVQRAAHGSFELTHGLIAGNSYYANITITATDQHGASSTIFVNVADLTRSMGIHRYPVVLDLDDDGVELLSAREGVAFDWLGYGDKDITGWVGKDDGFLVYDYDNNQQVTKADELALKDYKPGAKTDLEGLQAFDSNKNGEFDSEDDEWQNFGVWQDKNSNGITDDGEFTTLGEQGISSINLESDEQYEMVENNVVYGNTTYLKTDGSIHSAHDVGLNGEMVELTEIKNADRTLFNDSTKEIGEQQAQEQSDIESSDPNTANQPTELTEAELDRQFIQLQSDIAGNTDLDSSSDLSHIIIEDSLAIHAVEDETEMVIC